MRNRNKEKKSTAERREHQQNVQLSANNSDLDDITLDITQYLEIKQNIINC